MELVIITNNQDKKERFAMNFSKSILVVVAGMLVVFLTACGGTVGGHGQDHAVYQRQAQDVEVQETTDDHKPAEGEFVFTLTYKVSYFGNQPCIGVDDHFVVIEEMTADLGLALKNGGRVTRDFKLVSFDEEGATVEITDPTGTIIATYLKGRQDGMSFVKEGTSNWGQVYYFTGLFDEYVKYTGRITAANGVEMACFWIKESRKTFKSSPNP